MARDKSNRKGESPNGDESGPFPAAGPEAFSSDPATGEKSPWMGSSGAALRMSSTVSSSSEAESSAEAAGVPEGPAASAACPSVPG